MTSIATQFKLAQCLGLVAAVAITVLAGCVPSEDDFKADHPFLKCEDSIPGNGFIPSNPGQLGTAPKCFEFATSFDNFYSVTIPNTGRWFFKVVNQTGDMDLEVYDDVLFSNLLCRSANSGTADEVCEIDITGTGTAGILVEFFTGIINFYRLEVVQ